MSARLHDRPAGVGPGLNYGYLERLSSEPDGRALGLQLTEQALTEMIPHPDIRMICEIGLARETANSVRQPGPR